MTQSVDVPEGFKPTRIGGAFMALNGPLYARMQGERLQLGFRVEPRHTNPLNICHGGMLATFADMLLPCVAIYQAATERRFLPTISLQADYLAAAALGDWVQGEGEVLRTTRNMVFAQGLISADGVPAMRVSGIFKLGALIGDGSDRDPLQLRD
ncbi:MAG TPA: PaaI family thioesterase [Ramlibacter sp.]|nr:PaaI family thioesterase [Ramlibacter sp.]